MLEHANPAVPQPLSGQVESLLWVRDWYVKNLVGACDAASAPPDVQLTKVQIIETLTRLIGDGPKA